MGRILALDYGSKRTGIAITDELQLIASGLTTVATAELMDFLKKYLCGVPAAIQARICHAEKIHNIYLE